MTEPESEGSEPSAAKAKAEASAPKEVQSRRWVKRLVFLLYVFVLVEVGSRGFFTVARGVSLFNPNLQLVFYREMHPLFDREDPVSRDDGVIDVLLLGGSVLHHASGDIEPVLLEQLAEATGQPVKIHNLAMPGHMSIDSLNKYRSLAAHRFDVVVFYHGINETRMNNCPPDVWRDDYSHSAWHARVASIESHPEVPILVSPFTLHYLWIKMCDRFEIGGYLPRGRGLIKDEWLPYGKEIRSDQSFKNNLQQLALLAAERSDPLMVMTFATYLPKGYDLDASSESQASDVNDYAGGGTSILDMWGGGRNVVAALDRHNQVIRAEAEATSGIVFLDMAATLPTEGSLFNDVCHLSKRGCREYVKKMIPQMVQQIRSGQ
jgi:hypothetical protein